MNTLKPALIRIRQAAFLVRHLYLDLYLLEGEFQGEPLRMLVADDGSTLQYISNLAFHEDVRSTKKARVSALKASDLATSDADVVVVGANLLLSRLYVKKGFHIVPKWVCAVMDTKGRHPDEILKDMTSDRRHDISRNLRKAEQAGISFDVTTDPTWFETFYYDMYSHFAKHKYGVLVQMDSYRRVKRSWNKGSGIIMKQNGQMVGGSIFYLQGKTMRNPYLGVMSGHESILRSGGSQALYYNSMLLAHKHGCDRINFGSSRPFVSDGVLFYKLRWGTHVEKDDLATAAFAITTPQNTPVAQKFMAANPFFELVEGNLQLYKPDSVPHE